MYEKYVDFGGLKFPDALVERFKWYHIYTLDDMYAFELDRGIHSMRAIGDKTLTELNEVLTKAGKPALKNPYENKRKKTEVEKAFDKGWDAALEMILSTTELNDRIEIFDMVPYVSLEDLTPWLEQKKKGK